MRNWMRDFMIGRYGMDNLNRFVLCLLGALVIIGLFVHIRLLHWLTVVLLILLCARIFSRSIYKRQQENRKYLELKAKFTGKGGSGKNSTGFGKSGVFGKKAGFGRSTNDGKRILICPYCKEKLRVPVGAGTIKIRCPHCQREFEETV